MTSDSEIIEQILAGDIEAYAHLVSRYERLARAAALRVVRNSHLADDVAQEAFVAGFQSLASLRDRSNFGGWLLGIVKKRAATAVQRDRRRASACDDLSNVREPQAHAEPVDLLDALEHLPEQERVVIGLKYFDGHSAEDIGRITGRPVGTVTKQLSRARRRLHDLLAEEVVNHE